MFLNGLILLTNLCWSAWGIFDKKALAQSSPRTVILIQYFLAIPELLLLVGYLLLTEHGINLNAHAIMWAGFGSVTSTMAMIAYLVAMSRADASYVLGITASYPLVMQVLAAIFLGESLVGNRLLGSVLIGLGVFAIGQSDHAVSSTPDSSSPAAGAVPTSRQNRRLITACVIFATIGWGIHGLFDKKAVSYAAPLAVMTARCCFDIVTFAVLFSASSMLKLERRLNNARTWRFCSLSTLCLLIGYICYLTAMTLSTASYVIVITGCYPLLMYLFALLFLGEKLNLTRLAGVIFVVAGGIVVQFTQSS